MPDHDDRLESPRPPRQPCPGPRWALGLMAGLGLWLGGCFDSRWGCVDSDDCAPGLTCLHWMPGDPKEVRYCVKPCPVEADLCDDGAVCYCPDSPLKGRCYDDRGERIGVCQER